MKLVNQYGFDFDTAKQQIEANRHNHCTTTYALLLKKYERKEKLGVDLGYPFKKLTYMTSNTTTTTTTTNQNANPNCMKYIDNFQLILR